MKQIKLPVPMSYHSTNLRNNGLDEVYEEHTFTSAKELKQRSCVFEAAHWLELQLAKHETNIEEVTFLPEDSIEHCNTQGLPCYMYYMGVNSNGHHEYYLNTTFVKQ